MYLTYLIQVDATGGDLKRNTSTCIALSSHCHCLHLWHGDCYSRYILNVKSEYLWSIELYSTNIAEIASQIHDELTNQIGSLLTAGIFIAIIIA